MSDDAAVGGGRAYGRCLIGSAGVACHGAPGSASACATERAGVVGGLCRDAEPDLKRRDLGHQGDDLSCCAEMMATRSFFR